MAFVEGSRVASHRAAYEAVIGPIPDGMFVLHKFDVKSLINPDHRWLGTQQANMMASLEKGQCGKPIGGLNVNAKLTNKQAIEIYTAQGLQREIGARYGVAQSIVSSIKRGRTWRHFTGHH